MTRVPDPIAAQRMLQTFACVGARVFDVTITDRQALKVQFKGGLPLDRLIRSMPGELESAAASEQNVIVRPRGFGVFIQLDDLQAEAIERVSPVSFLGLKTSPGNYQAWVAMNESNVHVLQQLRSMTNADLCASGATRIAGSLNFKVKYAPDYPLVEIVNGFQERIASKETLASIGIHADAPFKKAPRPVFPHRTPGGPRRWPSYRICLECAPPAHGDPHRPDVSRADFTWCMIAIDWGWSIKETAGQLLLISPKARENGPAYAMLTAGRAAAAVDRNRLK